MDLFADRLNAQTEKYMSWKTDPFAVGTDSFPANWERVNAYAFPPNKGISVLHQPFFALIQM